MKVVDKPVTVADLFATVATLLGMNPIKVVHDAGRPSDLHHGEGNADPRPDRLTFLFFLCLFSCLI